MISVLKRNIFPILLILLIPLFYFSLTRTFYQQDEWHGMGDILTYGINSVFVATDWFRVFLGEGRVLADLLVYFFLSKFPFSIIPIAIFAIFLHSLNAVFVYFLGLRFLKRPIVAFTAAIFFSFNAVSHGSVTWVASSMGTLPATTLILASLFAFLDERLIMAFVLAYFSLFFKETGIFLFFFYPLFDLISKRKFDLKRFWPFLLTGFIVVGIRVLEFREIPIQQDLFLTGSSKSFIFTLVIRAFTYPFLSFSQIFVPHIPLFEFAKKITWNYYDFFPSGLYDLVAQSAVIDLISLLGSSILVALLYFLFKNSKEDLKLGIKFWLIFSLMSFLPYIIVGKTGSYLESRYYYLAAISAGMLLGYFLLRFYNSKLVRTASFLAAGFLIIIHARYVTTEINKQVFLARERLNILGQLLKIKGEFSGNKNIFYISGDRNYYITEGNPIPMQQGMGYTILIWYYAQNKVPHQLKELVSDYYLWDMDGQGYKEVDGIGYGYFWDKEKLKQVILDQKLKRDNITGFYYDSQKEELIDITQNLAQEFNLK